MQNETGIIGITNNLPKLLSQFHRAYVIDRVVVYFGILISSLIVSIL